MKKIVLITFAIVSQFAFSQITKKIGDFDKVKVFDRLNVKLIPATENKIVITGKRESEVEVLNKNGELKIRMPFPKLLSGNDILIKLYFKKIESIDANEGTYVSCDYIFKQTTIDLNAREGAEISVDLDVEKANLKAVSGGIIDVSGKATNQDVTITSGGVLKASEMFTTQTTIVVSAGGDAEIHATLLVDAKVKAGGSIYIYGKPKQINQKIIIGGTIEEKE